MNYAIETGTAKIYIIHGRRTRRYFTLTGALNRLAWDMIRNKYPSEFVPFLNGLDEWDLEGDAKDFSKLHRRLVRFLKMRIRRDAE
jgi:hypothetical protein